MPVTRISQNSGTGTSTDASVSISTSGGNRILLAFIATSNVAPTAVSYGGDTMTSVVSETSNNADIWIYRLVAPKTGSNTLDVTFGSSITWYVGGVSYTNVNQSSPIVATNNSAGNSSGNKTLSVTTTADDMAVGGMHALGGVSDGGGGDTLVFEQSDFLRVQEHLAVGASTSITIRSDTAANWGLVVCSLAFDQAPGGGSQVIWTL